MTESRVKIFATVGQAALLLLLAGVLIGRRDFAHLNLSDFIGWLKLLPPPLPLWSSRAFVTETLLLALLPCALIVGHARFSQARGVHWRERFVNAFGTGSACALAFIAYGAAHGVAGKISGGDTYLVFRQSALAAYAVVFIYTQIFFGGAENLTRWAALAGIAASLACAALDTFGWLGPKQVPETGEWMPIYGQETLPLAILGLGYFFVAQSKWYVHVLCAAGMVFAAWRQAARPMQSVVPIGMAGAFALLLLLSIILALRGQSATLKRAALCVMLFAVLAVGYRALKSQTAQNEQPGTEASSEIKAWSLNQYGTLFEIFKNAHGPADAAQRMSARRPPYVPVSDEEVYKLQAVFEATPSVSVRNNIWRFLVWRRMLLDWRAGNIYLGSGVGQPWFYTALYQSGFHYGDPREGLDPHNSYVNTLHRFGLLGLGLLLSIVAVTIFSAFKALFNSRGEPLLEALLLYFFYTLVFACFTVSLEGPAYSLPFWFALGLVAARARSIRCPDVD